MEVGWAQEVWGTEVPQRGPGTEPRLRVWAKPPEARYAYTICSGQTHFRDLFIEDIWCTFRLMRSLLPHPYSSKETLRTCANLTINPGQGRVGTCRRAHRAPPWLRHYRILRSVSSSARLHVSETSTYQAAVRVPISTFTSRQRCRQTDGRHARSISATRFRAKTRIKFTQRARE